MRVKRPFYFGRILILLTAISLSGCLDREFIEMAAINTGEVEVMSARRAIVSGDIIDVGQGITEYGHCWATRIRPTIDNNRTNLGIASSKLNYTSTLSDLEPATTYYIRSYLKSGASVTYGKEVQFSTGTGIATIRTSEISYTTFYTAIVGASILNDGGDSISSKGVCWVNNGTPTIDDNVKFNSSDLYGFTDTIRNNKPHRKYFIRGFAVNSVGIDYGNTIEFSFRDTLDYIKTSPISNISQTQAVSGGEILGDIGEPILARGVCWSTLGNPSINDDRTVEGVGIGSYTSNLTGLRLDTKYYLRAYLTSKSGTIYGEMIQFTTQKASFDIITSYITDVTMTSAASGGFISSSSDEVISRGVCWNTNGNPEVTDFKTSNGASFGNFTSLISGLIPNTTYYLSAYATISEYTAYGNVLKFRTFNDSIIDIDGNWYNTVVIGDQEWMVENLRSTKLNDGTELVQIPPSPAHWRAFNEPSFRWPNDNESNKQKFGVLYKGYTIMTDKICPIGWHVPSDTEWTTLTNYLGGSGVAGGKMKSREDGSWLNKNYGATNESGFSALPAGYITATGSPNSFGSIAIWWTSTLNSNTSYWDRIVKNYNGEVLTKSYSIKGGLSIRCIAD